MTYSLSFSQADNGGGRWTQLLESFWATRLLSSIVIYCKRTLILREICHNTELARCVSPVVEASPRPLGHPVKHGDIYSLSYLGSHHLTLLRGRGMEGPWLKITNLNKSELQIKPMQLSVSVCVNEFVWSYTVGRRYKEGKTNTHSETGAVFTRYITLSQRVLKVCTVLR